MFWIVRNRLYLLQAFPYLEPETLNELSFPQFHIHVKCMYDFVCLNNGIDPDAAPASKENTSVETGGEERKLSGASAIAEIKRLAAIKAKAKEET